MMSDVEHIESSDQNLSVEQSPGELLAQAREAKGLSRIEVSETLGLTVSVIRDIELSRFERFPTGVYTRGYVKNFCKLVDADLAEVMAAYDRHGEEHTVPEEAPFGTTRSHTEPNDSASRTFIFAGAAFVMAAAIALYFILV